MFSIYNTMLKTSICAEIKGMTVEYMLPEVFVVSSYPTVNIQGVFCTQCGEPKYSLIVGQKCVCGVNTMFMSRDGNYYAGEVYYHFLIMDELKSSFI